MLCQVHGMFESLGEQFLHGWRRRRGEWHCSRWGGRVQRVVSPWQQDWSGSRDYRFLQSVVFIRDRSLCWFPLGQEEKYSVPLVITAALLCTLHGNNELPKSGELHTSGPQCTKTRGVGVPKCRTELHLLEHPGKLAVHDQTIRAPDRDCASPFHRTALAFRGCPGYVTLSNVL